MYQRNLKSFTIVLGSIFLIFPDTVFLKIGTHNIQESACVLTDFPDSVKPGRYNSVTVYNNMFIAAGSEGRIDRISLSGNITKTYSFPGENFKGIASDNRNVIVAGEKGVIRISFDGKTFTKVYSGTDTDINSVTIFNRTIIAGGDKGTIIFGDPEGSFNVINLNLKGNIVSLSAGLSQCYGVTDDGEIIHTDDAVHWDIFDYNRVYSGYYKQCSFTSVLVTLNRIAVAGKQDDGSPVVAFSSQGNVWTERILSYTDDQGFMGFLNEIPNSILYDEAGDQYFLACNRGTLLLLPGCTQCNKVTRVSDEDLSGLSFNGNKMIVVGNDYFARLMDIAW